ncbi:MAG: polyphenol oxidase family protein [Spirochaetota bacterium]
MPATEIVTLELPLSSAEPTGRVHLPFAHPAWLTLRSAGDMRDRAIRIAVLEEMGYRAENVCMVRQTHSRIVVDARDLLRAGSTAVAAERVEGDGIVSGPGGPFLAVGVGDCAPLYLADLRTGAYALLHSGWRGTGILRCAIDRLAHDYGSKPEDLVLTIGPCISADAYVVDEERASEYTRWGRDAVVYRCDRPYLDMRAANARIARELGVSAVSVVNHCTYTTSQLGSFRREGASGYTGMLALLGPTGTANGEDGA